MNSIMFENALIGFPYPENVTLQSVCDTHYAFFKLNDVDQEGEHYYQLINITKYTESEFRLLVQEYNKYLNGTDKTRFN
jgi:hypothetical protein